jgi:hypothetical protein
MNQVQFDSETRIIQNIDNSYDNRLLKLETKNIDNLEMFKVAT